MVMEVAPPIDARALLPHIGRRQVDRNSLTVRKAETGVEQSGFDALAALSNGGIRHADRDEIARGTGWIKIHLHVDQMRVNAVNGCAVHFEERHLCSSAPRVESSLCIA